MQGITIEMTMLNFIRSFQNDQVAKPPRPSHPALLYMQHLRFASYLGFHDLCRERGSWNKKTTQCYKCYKNVFRNFYCLLLSKIQTQISIRIRIQLQNLRHNRRIKRKKANQAGSYRVSHKKQIFVLLK